jgi:hypothetical protein
MFAKKKKDELIDWMDVSGLGGWWIESVTDRTFSFYFANILGHYSFL